MFLKCSLTFCGVVCLFFKVSYSAIISSGQSPVPQRQYVANASLTSDVGSNGNHETTTYKYPTATWSADNHMKKKTSSVQDMWKLYLFKPSPFLKPPFTDGEAGAAISRIEDGLDVNGRRRGKIRWKGEESQPKAKAYDAVLDKFLRDSLQKYIKTANLTDEFGTITLEMFAEALNKVTSAKKPSYDENKELHRKFKQENLTAKKSEITTEAGLVEKQYQKRLQKTWEIINENISVPSRGAVLDQRENIQWVMTELTTPLPVTTTTDSPPTEAVDYSTYYPEISITEQPVVTTTDTTVPPLQKVSVAFSKVKSKYKKDPLIRSRGPKKYRDTVPRPSPEDMNEVTFSVAESSYYGSRQNDIPETSKKEAEYGAIPGVPHIDYPTLSQPLATGFKCPKLLKGSAKMLADPKSRCQVFYMCSGDGPPTPMLCPNGTLFNEQVHVCDWWFNVDCPN